MGPLYEATIDLHRAVEQTAFGKSMADGTVTPANWTYWLRALYDIHNVIDLTSPEPLHRAEEVRKDLIIMYERGYESTPSPSIETYIQSLNNENQVLGAAYVLGGAHVMGGSIIMRIINGRLPCLHLNYNDEQRRSAILAVKTLRDRVDLIEPARDCFKSLLKVNREIDDR